MVKHLLKFIECTASNGNLKLWTLNDNAESVVIHCCNECTSLVQGIDSRGGCVEGGRRHMETLYFPLNFTLNLKLL